jgi:hypothetical protein
MAHEHTPAPHGQRANTVLCGTSPGLGGPRETRVRLVPPGTRPAPGCRTATSTRSCACSGCSPPRIWPGSWPRCGAWSGRGGVLAVTTWGPGLFEPANGRFWRYVGEAEPALFKAFNPWDEITTPEALAGLFARAGVPSPSVVAVASEGRHRLDHPDRSWDIVLGYGYRATADAVTWCTGRPGGRAERRPGAGPRRRLTRPWISLPGPGRARGGCGG